MHAVQKSKEKDKKTASVSRDGVSSDVAVGRGRGGRAARCDSKSRGRGAKGESKVQEDIHIPQTSDVGDADTHHTRSSPPPQQSLTTESLTGSVASVAGSVAGSVSSASVSVSVAAHQTYLGSCGGNCGKRRDLPS